MSTKPLHILLVDDDDRALLGIAVKMTDLNICLRIVVAEQAIKSLEGRGVYVGLNQIKRAHDAPQRPERAGLLS